MKLSEFVLTHKTGKSVLDWQYFADVTVTTGKWWWKKVERRKISQKWGCHWFFLDTGEYTPGYQVEALARAAEARDVLKNAPHPT